MMVSLQFSRPEESGRVAGRRKTRVGRSLGSRRNRILAVCWGVGDEGICVRSWVIGLAKEWKEVKRTED